MTTSEASARSLPVALRSLYLTRFGFAIVWAALIVVTGSDIGPVSGSLLVLYPLLDAAAAVVDLRSSRTMRSARGLYVNIVLSVAAVVGMVIAVNSDVAAVQRVWGVWAITTGVVQLVVALNRRRLGGQVPMILSGGISVLAGAAFIGMAAGDDPKLSGLGGYAALGGLFFLISALRLNHGANAPHSA
jgi:uncharacterized membrane protein HdeD (DUF308 family)